MNFNSTYLGLELANPLMMGASPLTDDIDVARRLEDAGAAAVVMRSLFEEQIEGEHYASVQHMEMYADLFPEASTFFPGTGEFAFNPDGYLEHIRRLKQALDIPVIASLNGMSNSGWLRYSKLIEQAGADALELNVYHVATQASETADLIEHSIREVARDVREAVQIPVAVKLSPFFTSIPNLALELRTVGIDGLVLFNRFYQPDFDLESLSISPQLHLSDSSELLLRVRWLAILSGRCSASLSASGGVHTVADVVKVIMAGAHSVQIVSAILRHGPQHFRKLLDELKHWMEENGYDSVRQMRGSLSLSRCPDPAAFERGNYMRVLSNWRSALEERP
jgi:dihydroorotate dehydrogenase (fumarate)